jgi:hypothetical protein
VQSGLIEQDARARPYAGLSHIHAIDSGNQAMTRSIDVAANMAASPQGMAQRYQAAYTQYGWQQYGAMPEAVTHALKTPDTVIQASNVHT